MALTKVTGSGLETGAATESLVGIDDNATSTAVTVDTNGNVGVGTSSPDKKLHVSGTGTQTVRIERTDTTLYGANVIGSIEFEGNDSNASGVAVSVKAVSEGTTGTAAIVFDTGTAGSAGERMRIVSNGNVGIGTSSPLAKQHVKKASAGTTHVDQYAVSVIEDAEARLQLISNDGGSNASLILLSNEAKHWGVAHKASGGSNAFSIGYGTTANTNTDTANVLTNHFNISTAGIVTTPNQPAFGAILDETWDVEGDMTFATTNLSDPAWNGTRFTAPVAGKYVFSWGGIGLNAAVGGGGTARMNINVNGVGGFGAEARADSSQEYDPASSTVILYLQATDYVTIRNSDTRGWYPGFGHFSGHLIG